MEDCYIFIEVEKTGIETIRVMCMKCHAEKGIGWFYEGSLKGYGPWQFKCHQCGHLIHDHKEKHD